MRFMAQRQWSEMEKVQCISIQLFSVFVGVEFFRITRIWMAHMWYTPFACSICTEWCRCRVFTCKRRFEALLPSDSLMGHPWARCSTHLASRSGLCEAMTSRWWMITGSNLQIMNLMVSVIKMLGRRASLRSQWSGLSSMYVDTAAEEGNRKPLQYSP